MLTPRENLLETIHGGHPDRFVNQYEPLKIIMHPAVAYNPAPKNDGVPVVNNWGVTRSWPKGTPGAFPVHTPDKIVIQDITRWRDYVHAPNLDFTDEQWEPFVRQAEAVDRTKYYVTPFIAPGLLEQCHYLGEIKNTMMYFLEEPECMHELIDYLTEYELRMAEGICSHLKPDALFHHDDWGSQISTFLSVPMFEEFFLESYKKIYGYYHEHGVQLVVHHSDSYAATLVPDMIEMGIDIWQGCMTSNNIPELIRKYGGRISFMGGIDSAAVDKPGWTHEDIVREVRRACAECGKLYFIPNASQGLPMSTFPGVYDELTQEIERCSREFF